MEFYAGSEHSAHIAIVNPTSWDWTYGLTLKVGSMAISRTVTVSAGQTGDVDIPVVMPSTPAELPVSVSIKEVTTGTDLGSYAFGTISVVAVPEPDVEVTLGWY